MNKITSITIILFLFIIAVFFLIKRPGNLKSQLIPELSPVIIEKASIDTSSCELLSEEQSNECYRRFALSQKEVELCGKMTKYSRRKECEREVELQK